MKKVLQKVFDQPFIKGFVRFYQSAESDITSIAVAYYLLISIFPLMLIAANILPYFRIRPTQILLSLQQVLPETLYRTVAQMISNILTKPSTGLLSFSIISALWIFSQSIAYLQRAYNKSYGVEKERGIIWGRLFSFLISFALQGLFGLSLILSMFGKMIVRYLYHTFSFDRTIYVRLLNLTEPMIYLLLFVSLVLLYYTLPNVKIPRFRYVLPGASFVVVVMYAILNIFWKYVDHYVSHFLDARFFGSVVLAIIMFWFILVAKIMIIGCILNASIQFARESKFETRNGVIVSKLQSEEVAFQHQKITKKLKGRLRFKRRIKDE